MDHNEMYDLVCKPAFNDLKGQIAEQDINQNKRFEQQDAKLDKVIEILKGNGKPGIISRIDDLERARRTATGVFGLIIKNWQIIIVLIILATTSIRGNKSPTSAEINDIITKVQSLEKLVSTTKPDQGT